MVQLTQTPLRPNPALSPLKTGVYMIRNKVNGKVYVGSAAGQSIKQRWSVHKSNLRRGIHGNRLLQNAWNKYGEEYLDFEALANCDPAWCLAMEQIHISKNKSSDRRFGYNLSPVSGSTLGVKHSPEVNKRNSERQIGKKMSAQSVESMKDAWRRRLADPDKRKKISEDFRVIAHSPEVLAKANEGKRRYWRNPNTEHVAKLDGWRSSDEHAELTRRQMKGVEKTPEHRARIGAAHVGMKRSAEARKKMSESAKRRCETVAGKTQMRNAGLASHGLPMEPIL